MKIKPYSPKEQKPDARLGWLVQWIGPSQSLETKAKE
jgi:hypothetical protein